MNSRRVVYNYSKLVVNPTTKISHNLTPNVLEPYTKKHDTLVKTVTPNLGKCDKTGTWENKTQIDECKSCIQKSSPEYPYFYCDGLCASKYDLGKGSCALNSLVAKNISQCSKPCQQYKAPSMSGGCQDDFDCSENSQCKLGTCVEFDTHKKKSKPIKKEDVKISESSIMNILKICSKDKNIKTCMDDLNKLNCQDVEELVKKNIEESHKNGSYKTERENIIKSFNWIKNNTEIEDEKYNELVDTLKNINCVIDEVNYQYELDTNEIIKPINITDQKAHYISNLLKSDKNLQNTFNNDTLFGENESNYKQFSLFYIIFIIILCITIILLLIFYRKNNLQNYKIL